MQTYRMMDGEVLDLGGLSGELVAHVRRSYDAWRSGATGKEMHALAYTVEHPLLRPTAGVVTPPVWEHPAFRATRDLYFRAEIRDGKMRPNNGDDISADPLDDEWVPSVEAARRKGVALPTIHGAIERGALVAKTEGDGRKHVMVSRNSLERWQPNAVRQAAARGQRVGVE